MMLGLALSTHAAPLLKRRGASDPLAGIDFTIRLQTHNGDNVPLGLYQDVACTIPAVNEFDPVGAWRDELSDSGRLLITDHTDHQPVLVFVDGVPVVEFDGVDDYMLTADFNFALADRTVCSAWGQTASNGNDGVLTFKPSSGNDDSQNTALMSIGAFVNIIGVRGGAGSAYFLGHTSTTPIPWNVTTDRCNAGSGALYVDGTVRDSGSYGSFGTATKGLLMASRFLGGTIVFQSAIQVGSVMICPTGLLDSDRELLESYNQTLFAAVL
jgi:hypothetical protein